MFFLQIHRLWLLFQSYTLSLVLFAILIVLGVYWLQNNLNQTKRLNNTLLASLFSISKRFVSVFKNDKISKKTDTREMFNVSKLSCKWKNKRKSKEH